MLVQCFELQGRRFTKFHYYYHNTHCICRRSHKWNLSRKIQDFWDHRTLLFWSLQQRKHNKQRWQVSSSFTSTVQCKHTTITEICRVEILYCVTDSEWFRSYSNILYTRTGAVASHSFDHTPNSKHTITGAVASPSFTPTTYSKHTITSLQQTAWSQ